MRITKLQIQTVIQEIEYYFSYDQWLDGPQKKNLLSALALIEDKNLPFDELSTEKLEWVDIIKYYFVSHTDSLGNIVSLQHHVLINEEIRTNYQELKDIENRFLKQLFKKMKPLYYLDVDNTLTDNAYLSYQKIDFIKNWKNKQNIILNTGKVSSSIMNIIQTCELEHNYYSCLNGSVIVKDGNFEIISRIGEVSKSIIEDILETDLRFITYYEDCIHVIRELTEDNIYLLKKYNEWFIDETLPTNYKRIVKILTFIKEEEKEKEEVVKKIVTKYPNLVGVRTAAHCYEILHQDQHKGNSVKKIAEYMNKYYRVSIGVGDSMNDLRMLDYVGVPYIVSNSSQELKQYGFEIIKGTRDIDIVNILKKYE